MDELNGDRLSRQTRLPRPRFVPADQGRRSEIFALIRAFNSAVASPGGAQYARRILDWTIDALDGADPGEVGAMSAAAADGADGLAHARIVEELKSVQNQWRATEVATLTADFVHAMDGLLMYEIARAEASRDSARATRVLASMRRAHGRPPAKCHLREGLRPRRRSSYA